MRFYQNEPEKLFKISSCGISEPEQTEKTQWIASRENPAIRLAPIAQFEARLPSVTGAPSRIEYS